MDQNLTRMFGNSKLMIGVGPPRTGTTWVHQLLAGHPQCAVTAIKEVNYFNKNYECGPDWYRAQFVSAPAACRAFIDMSPEYAEDSRVPARIEAASANLLLLLGMRSPYDRALSFYRKFLGHAVPLAVLLGHERLFAAMARPVAEFVADCLDRFGRERIHFLYQEELESDPLGAARDLQSLLGIEAVLPSSADRRVHGVRPPRRRMLNPRLHRLACWFSDEHPALHRRIVASPLPRLLFGARVSAEPPRGDVARLFKALEPSFERDIDRMERLAGRNLGSWRIAAQLQNFDEHPHRRPSATGSAPPAELSPAVSTSENR